MNFREEYKNNIEIMSPSAEQLERMKKNILEQAKAPEKKAIPFKKIAYIGSAVAACAVISVAAINIVPRLSGGSADLTATESTACASDEINYAADLADGAAGGAVYEDQAVGDAEMATELKSESAHPLTTTPAMNEAVTEEVAEDADFDASDDVYNDACEDTAADSEGGSMTGILDGITDNTFVPSATTTAVLDYDDPQISPDTPATDEAFEPVSGEAENEFSVELSADFDVLILNDVKYILVDDGDTPPAGDLVCENWFAPDGTEYWFDHYGDNYIVLMCDYGNGFEVVGGYKKAE